jgi:hypothetical protein
MTGYPYFRVSLERYLKIPIDAKEKTKKPSKEFFEGTGVLVQRETVETVR